MQKSPIWTRPFTLEELNTLTKNTLSDHLGIAFVEVGDRFLTARMQITQAHLQPMGVMHGGATAALAETVASIAANYCIESSNKTCVGIELNINHLRALKQGHVDATAQPLHIGKTTQVWEIKIFTTTHLISAARLTLSVIDIK